MTSCTFVLFTLMIGIGMIGIVNIDLAIEIGSKRELAAATLCCPSGEILKSIFEHFKMSFWNNHFSCQRMILAMMLIKVWKCSFDHDGNHDDEENARLV